ncbi:TetR family transcriptional regulator [Actinoplanes sp. NPDC000266]
MTGMSPSPPRRRDASATRQALLEAGRARFARVGYESTTLRDVAADVGVNLALIKRYFGSKEGLFKAALSAQPRFLADLPPGREAFAAAFSRQLAADAWPEFGEHPVLMLLRASGDEGVSALRREALRDAAVRLLDALSVSSGGRPRGNGPEGRALVDEAVVDGGAVDGVATDALLRAELLVALGVGVAVLRSAVGVEPLAGASADQLAGPLRGIVDGLIPPSG